MNKMTPCKECEKLYNVLEIQMDSKGVCLVCRYRSATKNAVKAFSHMAEACQSAREAVKAFSQLQTDFKNTEIGIVKIDIDGQSDE